MKLLRNASYVPPPRWAHASSQLTRMITDGKVREAVKYSPRATPKHINTVVTHAHTHRDTHTDSHT